MKKSIEKIIILPARFIEVVNNEKIRIKMMLDNGDIQEKTMGKIMIDNIENPDYLFVGISLGVNHTQLDVCDGSEFKNIFHEKWSSL